MTTVLLTEAGAQVFTDDSSAARFLADLYQMASNREVLLAGATPGQADRIVAEARDAVLAEVD